eukprot:746950-Hanusia_phi.AAC.2
MGLFEELLVRKETGDNSSEEELRRGSDALTAEERHQEGKDGSDVHGKDEAWDEREPLQEHAEGSWLRRRGDEDQDEREEGVRCDDLVEDDMDTNEGRKEERR